MACAVVFLTACTTLGEQSQSEATADFDWQLPPGFSPPTVPESNPMTVEKVELGRRLFFDTRLSVNGQGSCASCHQQRLAFTDGRSQAIGVTGELHERSSMSLINVAYNNNYTWASRDIRTLEQQIPQPLFNQDPIELGLSGNEKAFIADLRSSQSYPTQFERAFPDSEDPVSLDNTVKALATFVRTIISADSAFDRLLYLDDRSGMSDSALRGMRLFYADRLNCSACHEGQNLASGRKIPGITPIETEFHNTGLYNVANLDRYPVSDPGLRIETGLGDDDGRFRAPTLRNIAITAPYMHDGSIPTLSEVIDHYAAGGRTLNVGINSGAGNENAKKSRLVSGFELDDDDKSALISFLESLTDHTVLADPRFSDPAEFSH